MTGAFGRPLPRWIFATLALQHVRVSQDRIEWFALQGRHRRRVLLPDLRFRRQRLVIPRLYGSCVRRQCIFPR